MRRLVVAALCLPVLTGCAADHAAREAAEAERQALIEAFSRASPQEQERILNMLLLQRLMQPPPSSSSPLSTTTCMPLPGTLMSWCSTPTIP
jgi:hypothetical protein